MANYFQLIKILKHKKFHFVRKETLRNEQENLAASLLHMIINY